MGDRSGADFTNRARRFLCWSKKAASESPFQGTCPMAAIMGIQKPSDKAQANQSPTAPSGGAFMAGKSLVASNLHCKLLSELPITSQLACEEL